MSRPLSRLLGAALLVVIPASALAQASPRPQDRKESTASKPEHARQAEPAPARNDGKARQASDRTYGTWNSSWGSRPPAPPRHWTKTADWHRHVRACQVKFRSYDARTDTYRTHSGKTRRCTL